MDQLLIALAGMKYSSDNDETNKVNNLAYDKLIQKYELGLLKLHGQANDNGLHVYYEKKLKTDKTVPAVEKNEVMDTFISGPRSFRNCSTFGEDRDNISTKVYFPIYFV